MGSVFGGRSVLVSFLLLVSEINGATALLPDDKSAGPDAVLGKEVYYRGYFIGDSKKKNESTIGRA